MIENLPYWIDALFLLTYGATLGLFYFANGKPTRLLVLIVVWSIVQSVLAFSGFYQITDSMPPRFALVLLPSVLLIIYGLLPQQLEQAVQDRNLEISPFLHTIRIPVEIVLLHLYLNKMIPELMTFEGRNFDILAGITAPIMGLLYLKNKLPKSVMLGWNVICLFLVCFILTNGLLSAELPFQQFAFEQPNKAINFFPFVLLPAVIVPIVIYTHLVDIVKLRRKE